MDGPPQKMLVNPFTPGNGLDPPYLAGREDEDELFRRSLRRAGGPPPNLGITGLRGGVVGGEGPAGWPAPSGVSPQKGLPPEDRLSTLRRAACLAATNAG